MVTEGDDLGEMLSMAFDQAGITLVNGDVVCVAQKIISKAEGRLLPLHGVTPSERAIKLAEETEKDPRLVELILQESTEVLRKKPGVLIMRHKLGLVGAHAGVDQSNIEHGDDENALLLPVDPDASAAALKADLEQRHRVSVGVIVTDSANRPWRLGTVGTAIGCAGITVLDDHRGGQDLYGRELKVTLINRADALAGAATLVMGETVERTPVVLIRGLAAQESDQDAKLIVRPLDEDLFR
ncbi:MAG: coenzyme F420-0:L-glutamate ligase [Gammaproteobacteria bacterium]|nr:coenzyme F420-0:L-glutamate ligase [Gammaproteobacteria bacterium]|tara:strand:- start:41 stop:763 length:723 start_codon:yes stop_codon:yes gene_type:complete